MMFEDIVDEVFKERKRQNKKWGDDFIGRDPNEWLAILLEELGEMVAEEPGSDECIIEMIQSITCMFSWLEHIDTQGKTNQFPQGAVMSFEMMSLGDRAKEWLETRSIKGGVTI